jgi:hypothetical protein
MFDSYVEVIPHILIHFHSLSVVSSEANAEGYCIAGSSVLDQRTFITTGPGGSLQFILAPGAQLDGKPRGTSILSSSSWTDT